MLHHGAVSSLTKKTLKQTLFMTQEQIIEGNKLIAEFMGARPRRLNKHWWTGFAEYPHDIHISSIQYHTSWDWLMPVVEKIHYLKHPTMPGFGHYKGKVTLLPIAISMKSVYTAVVEFLTWYNQQPK